MRRTVFTLLILLVLFSIVVTVGLFLYKSTSHTASQQNVILPTPNSLITTAENGVIVPKIITQQIMKSPNNKPWGRISGIVQDMNTGLSIEGVTIVLERYSKDPYMVVVDTNETSTDANGHFSFSTKEPGKYNLTLNNEALALYDPIRKENVVLTESQPIREGIVLKVGPSGSVKGRVYDVDTQQGIPGVIVSSSTQNTETDHQGHYIIHGNPVGTTTIFIKDTAAYSPELVSEKSLKALIIPNQTIGDFDFALKKGITLKGKVLDNTGNAVTNGSVYANNFLFRDNTSMNYHKKADINNNGTFIIEGLPHDVVHFKLSINSHKNEHQESMTPYWNYEKYEAKYWEGERTFTIKKNTLLHASVLDSQTHEPITDFNYLSMVSKKNKVPIDRHNMFSPISHPEGQLVLPIQRRNAYTTVFIRAKGYADAVIHFGHTGPGEVIKKEILMEPGGMLHGHVVDTFGNAHKRATIHIGGVDYHGESPHGDIATDLYGDFWLPLKEGEHTIYATAYRNKAACLNITIETGKETHATFVLGYKGQIRGRIAKNNTGIKVNIKCKLTDPEGRTHIAQCKSNEDGTYHLDGLPNGKGQVIISNDITSQEISSISIPIHVTEGMETVVDYNFPSDQQKTVK